MANVAPCCIVQHPQGCNLPSRYETANAIAAMAVVMHEGGGVSEEEFDDSGTYARFEDRRWSLLVMVFLLDCFEVAFSHGIIACLF